MGFKSGEFSFFTGLTGLRSSARSMFSYQKSKRQMSRKMARKKLMKVTSGFGEVQNGKNPIFNNHILYLYPLLIMTKKEQIWFQSV